MNALGAAAWDRIAFSLFTVALACSLNSWEVLVSGAVLAALAHPRVRAAVSLL
jgi:hypothetical protein